MELTKSRIVNEWKRTYDEMVDLLPLPQEFTVTSFDGIVLKAKYYQRTDSTHCAIIFAHGWTDMWAGSLKYVPALEDCDCDFVLYDQRVHGASGGDYATGGIRESKDLLAVTEQVQKDKDLPDNRIGWMGSSWGGAAVLTAGADAKKIAFMIADAPFQDWYSAIFERAIRDYGGGVHLMSYGVMQMVNWRAGVDYTEASVLKLANKIEEPVLLIHSKTDLQTNSQQSVNISQQLQSSKSVFHHLDWGHDHTKDVLFSTERYKTLVNDFIGGVDSTFLKGGVGAREQESGF